MFTSSSNKIEKEFKNLRKELLDLTLRNPLLNFKIRAKTLKVENQSPINIFQNLVIQNKKMYFAANQKEDENENKSRFSIWDHSPIDFSKFTDGDKTLRVDLTPKELQKRLFYINNQAKTMLQEKGYNILYLAVGFLEWYDDSKKKQKNLAPLILIPVTIERKKVGKSFDLFWTGEDLQTNISLKAKLKEIGLNLPDFEFKLYSEVIDHYIKEVSEVIQPMKKWKVNNDVALGFFSFKKFVMYNDLNPSSWEKNVDLTKKDLIQAIFNPSDNNEESFNEQDIDKQLEYENMYQVLDADSSQIAAIEDVKAGRNLVVEGPPGTGKSQTIVNLIAELLAEGKSVLFVSEKMAALDVVKDRLQGVGLGKFILELHSHKTRRKKFLKDLEKAATVRAEETFNVDQTIRKLETLKRQLDNYAEIIHKPLYGVDLSAFDLYGMKESADSHFSKKNMIIPLVRFDNPQEITNKDLDDIILNLENITELYHTISAENPWSKCSPKSLLPSDLREIELLINDTIESLNNFLVERDAVYETFGIKKPDTLNEFKNSLEIFEFIESKNSSLIDSTIIQSSAWKDSNNVDILINNLETYQNQAKILDKFHDNVLDVDIDQLIDKINQLSNKKFRLFKNRENEKLFKIYYKDQVPSTEQILADFVQIQKIRDIKKQLDLNENIAKSYFGQFWHLKANIDDLRKITNWMREFIRLIEDGIFSQNTVNILSKDLFNINRDENLSEYIQVGKDFENKLFKLKDKLNPRTKLIFKRDIEYVTFQQWIDQLNNWKGQLSSLHLWSQYLNTKNAAKGTFAEPFISVIEKKRIPKDDIKSLVYGNFADSLLNIIFAENQELASFIGELHENRIKEFKDLDRNILELNRKRIFHKLNSNIPRIFGVDKSKEEQILAGEFTRKSGHLPVRKLLQKAGGIIKKIKPIFMMSPLSIAQYLDPTNDELQFDVVIFDEASQVKPQDALGAFMRAKTAVVMGDTQQLPPTSFFDKMAEVEIKEEEATSLDMESILHLCKLSFPVKMLKWHYRSRHESLISVSNNQFYDDELLVYPSPSHDDPELGLKLHYNSNTYYNRGSSASNRLEAKDVVKAIFEHFDRYGDTKTLGVGTFSVAQKNAILEELEIERKNRPEFEYLFDEKKDNAFFVKNLETIQGDERDVILISIGYGFDNEGKLSLNFGPLNQEGGERRLNVLITRAKEKCVVFSNFKSHDMHLTDNPPFGVKALKEFLAYAENLNSGNIEEIKNKEPFNDAIYNFLIEKGYKVNKQIGNAGFKLDLAIIDEDNPGKYYLGITTDGNTYSSNKVARDRDRLREQVLKSLGWNIYHLWSTDWYRNRDLGRQKLIEAIENSKIKYKKEEQYKKEEAEKQKIESQKRLEELKKAKEKTTDNLESENTENTSTQANNNDYSDFNIIKENTEQQNNDMPKESINEELYSSQLNNDKNIGNSINNNIKNESAEDDLEYENKKEFSNNQKKSSDVKFRDNIIKSNDSTFNNNINEEVNNSISNDFSNQEEVQNEKFNSSNNIENNSQIEYDDNIYDKDFESYSNSSNNNINEEVNNSISNDFSNQEEVQNEKFNSSNNIENNSQIEYEDNIYDKDFESYSNSSSNNNANLKRKTKKRFFDSLNANIRNGETKLNVSGNKSYDNDLNPVYIPKVEVNKDKKEPLTKDKIILDAKIKNSQDIHDLAKDIIEEVSKEDENEKKEENKILDDTFDEMLNQNYSRNNITYENNNAQNSDILDSKIHDTVEIDLSNKDENSNIINEDNYKNSHNNLKDYKNDNVSLIIDDESEEPSISDEDKIEVIDYQLAEDIGLSSSNEIYNKPLKEVSESINKIVEIEGPIHINEVINRVKSSCNLKRASIKFKNKLNEAIELSEISKNIVIIDDFLFDSKKSRINLRKRQNPNIDLIANEEIEKSIENVLKRENNVNISDLVKKTSKNFGFQLTSKKTATKINSILDQMLENGKVEIIDGNIVELR